jgi:hypothetical protein
MGQRAADATVAVGVRMDDLELRVHDPGMGNHRDVLSVHERNEVLDQRGDPVRVRRDVAGIARAVVGSADPVLFAADLA